MIGLEYILKVSDIQQKDLAEELGIKKQNINLWIKGAHQHFIKAIFFNVVFLLTSRHPASAERVSELSAGRSFSVLSLFLPPSSPATIVDI